MVRLEVIISTMNVADDDFSLVEKMNIQTDAIIINQTDHVAYNEYLLEGHTIRMFSFDERGVGLSRNNGLMRSTADICLMADDDMVYVNGYERIVLDAYASQPAAEFIVFNVLVHEEGRSTHMVRNNRKLRYWERFRYGTVSFTFKRERIVKRNLFFSLLFGGGAEFGSGEDTLFLWAALRSNVRVYTSGEMLADVHNHHSTWFKGNDEQYYFDKGALYQAVSPRLRYLFNGYIIWRTHQGYRGENDFVGLFKMMNAGAKKYSTMK